MKKFILMIGIFAMALLCANPCQAVTIPKGVGVNIHFTGAPARDLDLIKNAGFNQARTDLKWDRVERTRGQYNWTEYDQLIDGLLARGITPYMILDYNNPVYGAGGMDGIHTSEQRTGFTNFAKAAAARYKGKTIIFEIWNEPNLGSIFWRPTENVGEYMALIKSVYPAMKAADPNCIVVGPGVAFIANTFDYLKQCMSQGLLNYVDGLSVHPYKNEAPEAGTVDYLYTELRNILGSHGKRDFPILGGEFGFSTSWSNVQNEKNQAEFLARQLVMHDYYNVVSSIVYDFRNDGTDPNNAEHNFGIIRNDYSIKPAYTAIQTQRQNLAGLTYSKRVTTSDASVRLYEYTSASGRTMAAWTTSGTKSATIYGKSVTLTTMPIYVKETTTTPPPPPPPEDPPAPPPTDPPAPPPTSSNTIPAGVGVNIHFTGAPARDLDLIKNAGFNMVRTDLKWDQVESTKGQYVWTQYDQLIDGLLARGITPYMILDYNNTLYGAGSGMAGITTSTQIQGFTNFAKAAAARYKGKKIIFEIWNEPNLDIFWTTGPNSTQYMNLVKSVVPAMKAADPNCIVVGPGVAFIANTFEFLHGCCVQGLLDYVDGLSVHPYKNANPEEGTIDYLYNSVKGIVRDYGHPDMPILGGEFGFSTSWSNVGDEQNQAEFLARQLVMHDFYNVPVSIVYDFRNDGTDPNNAEHNFGVIRNDYSIKPAYNAIKAQREALAGMTFSSKLSSNTGDYLYEYTGPSGKLVAAWTTGSPHSVTVYGKSVQITQMPTYVKETTTTPPPPPPPPPTATAPVINSIKLNFNKTLGQYVVVVNWADNAANETGFEVFRSIGDTNNFQRVKTIAALTGTNQTITYRNNIGATPTTGTYYYKIVVKFADSTTQTSNTKSVEVKLLTPPPVATVPAVPANITGSAVEDISNNNVVILKWTDAATDEDGFNIYCSNSASAAFSKIGTISKDKTTVVHPVSAIGTYSYKVKSFNQAGESTEPPVTTVTIN
ncbi:MAG: hypothetical protein A2Y25_08195 [Candidatus Melainabacteria bacterium GWF2_37_15]|nr:MAG: hypothetical protein A2Y25_08195 [Candidatus Melainabacteria bacterium GWF2_37_15]